MKHVFLIKPSRIASVVRVVRVTNPGITGPREVPVVYRSRENGIVVGDSDTLLANFGWPQEVQDSLTQHFKTVFDLRHEDWPGPAFNSPRAVYVSELEPWFIEVETEEV